MQFKSHFSTRFVSILSLIMVFFHISVTFSLISSILSTQKNNYFYKILRSIYAILSKILPNYPKINFRHCQKACGTCKNHFWIISNHPEISICCSFWDKAQNVQCVQKSFVQKGYIVLYWPIIATKRPIFFTILHRPFL